MNEPLLKDALSYEKVFTNNDDMYRKYQQREDAIRDEQTKIAMAERRGEEREKQRRIADNKAMAKEMINDNIPISFIAKYTKLSVDEIKNLNK